MAPLEPDRVRDDACPVGCVTGMDWTTIIVTTITATGSITLAWLALRSKLAELGKTATEAAHKAEEAATASHKTEQSINNRPIPASDRWDLIHDDVKSVKETSPSSEEHAS